MADSQNSQKEKTLATTKKPESETAGDTQREPKKKQTGEKKSALPVFTFLLLLILAGATGGGAYYFWQQQQLMTRQQSADIRSLQQEIDRLDKLTGDVASNSRDIKSQADLVQKLQQQQQQISDISQQAIRQSNRAQRDWILAEVDYLLRLANRRLEIARDINSAIAALRAADERIHELGDLNLLPIRKQLAEDIATLKSLHQVDVNGTALALDQMINHLSTLPFKSAEDEIKAQIKDEDKAASEEKPGSFVDSVISTVKNIGDIKVHQRSIQPASSAQQQQQIEQILRTHLLGARLAVLRYDQLQFSHDIQQAQQILHLHYKDSDNRVSQMRDDLNRFAGINLTPELPAITTAWNMLQDIIRQADLRQQKAKENKNRKSDTGDKPAAEVL